MKAAVIGHPVSHSLSPRIFRMISHEEGVPLDYTARDLEPAHLNSFLAELRANINWVGVNVTLPFKEEILPLLDELSEEARAIGAVNVIHVRRKKLKGYNTDVIGIRKTLANKKITALDQNILLIGAGGAARAMAYVMASQGAKTIYIYNPRSQRGTELCQSMGSNFSKVEFKAIQNLEAIAETPLAIVANCTPIGMQNEDETFFEDLVKCKYTHDALAFDLLYTPKKLPFLKIMKSINLATIDGLEMLIEQALATWEIWISDLNPETPLQENVKSALNGILRARENTNPIYLTGFMGVGKTALGRELAAILNRTFIDTDQWIENSAKLSILKIFEHQGEEAFRILEKKAVQFAAESVDSVVALGGGALNDPGNLQTVLDKGTLIYLKASASTLIEKLKGKTQNRPMFLGLSESEIEAKIMELLKTKTPIYENAQLKVDVHLKDTQYDTAQLILSAMGRQR